MRSPDRGRQLATASWTDRERSERAARRASEASQSPLTAIFKEELVRKYGLFFFFVYCTHRGMRSPDRGRQLATASWTDRERSERAARRASEASQSPSPPYLKKSPYESTGFFFVYCTHRGDEKPRPGCLVNAPVHSLSPRLMGEFCHESPRPEEFPPI